MSKKKKRGWEGRGDGREAEHEILRRRDSAAAIGEILEA